MVLAVYCVAVLHHLPAPVFRHFVDSAEEESRASEEPCEPHYRAFDDSESEDCGLEIRRAEPLMIPNLRTAVSKYEEHEGV